ncbi:uncharacterized protein BCR38DRAFT_481208 [Pseudomassariella vexata]|uniref:Amidohydrolase-related domain-containing protein n=1 Tax=Pseudomassariella vexata TaxID=1141098 RepID=A0A1Y2EF79_9PEZI|nr:uncharacterized protein BCR38DRAFT_481208 [Pseudomassariella vexata]ORY70057.1 hypothetical protein BCR38DRAFT_481208 [Pseudomassariella vexata]
MSSLVDIVFSKGLIVSVTPASNAASILEDGEEYQLQGRYVTPGVVDMHSHHMTLSWPVSEATEDSNEMHALFGTLTPFLRITESLKAYDAATKLIASGGITSSLLLPGSTNTMGGEGTVVKNVMKSGALGEYVVEEMLLEHGVPPEDRHRYMKMACGENPKMVYGHTRMGLAWLLRKHLARAKELMDKQEEWCDSASRLRTAAEQSRFVEQTGGFPEERELESTIGLLRGRVSMQNHCYEPEDLETMLGVTREFGIRARAFHHAIEAWQVPEMLKEYGENVTIATFAEFALYKHEAYHPSLYAGAILDAHGIPVAYKSDHSGESMNAKYVVSQAAVAHAFHLPAEKALQSVTSIPANALDLGFRIGYARKGYDADLVVWDSHPLSIGATPQQVFIDGIATLNAKDVERAMGSSMEASSAPPTKEELPRSRVRKSKEEAANFCALAKMQGQSLVIQGIRKSFLDNHQQLSAAVSTSGEGNLTLVINNGKISCLGSLETCGAAITATADGAVHVSLDNGHLLPGLTAVSHSLGMAEIILDEETGNGIAQVTDVKDAKPIDYAKYGVYFDGKSFARARLGGVTRAVTPPELPSLGGAGLVQGVSTGIRTSGTKRLLDGGIFQDEVGLHMIIGDANKALGSKSMAIKNLRAILVENRGKGNESAYGLVADGKMPLIIQVASVPDTQQIIAVKQDFSDVKIVINGGHGAPLVAKELAQAKIPVILWATRPAFASWETRESLPGPPLTRSPASILSEEGVAYAISVDGSVPTADCRIHSLALEAAWAAKYAGLSEHEAVRLVSRNVENILGLERSKDIVVWENNPLQHGASVVLSLETNEDGDFEVATCWPDDDMETSA